MNEQKKYDWMVYVSCMTFNHAPFIEDAMNGFTIQETNFPFVCAIVDDASTDGEQEDIKNYLNVHFDLKDKKVARHEETDDYVLTFARHKTNLNCHFAVFYLKYNHYKKKSKTPYVSQWRDKAKYIAICEGDDYWIDPLKLQKQVYILEENRDEVMVYSTAKVLYDGHINGIIGFKSCDFDSVVKKNGITTLTTLIKQEYYRKYYKEFAPSAPKNWKMGDYPLWLYLSLKGKIHFIKEPLGVYRKLEESASHSTDLQKSLVFANSICQIRNYFVQYVEEKTGIRKNKLRKEVAIENIKRVLSEYFKFKDISGARSYLKENRGSLSFFSYVLMKLRIVRHSLI